jgi:hypothetical protein
VSFTRLTANYFQQTQGSGQRQNGGPREPGKAKNLQFVYRAINVAI